MHKGGDTMYPEPEHDPIHKTKRNRHETECSMKRHGYGCGYVAV